MALCIRPESLMDAERKKSYVIYCRITSEDTELDTSHFHSFVMHDMNHILQLEFKAKYKFADSRRCLLRARILSACAESVAN